MHVWGILGIILQNISLFSYCKVTFTNVMFYIPFKAGHIRFHSVKQPHRWYCPRASSMKNRGRPPNSSITQYGIRNAPVCTRYWILFGTNHANKIEIYKMDVFIILWNRRVHTLFDPLWSLVYFLRVDFSAITVYVTRNQMALQ